jgi:CheY-like chemotaxis protein
MTHTTHIAALPVQKVVVVNGNTEVLGMLESVLDAGRYDMVFVEPGDRAYSQIKKVLPNLVILCTRIERLDGFQILSMLKLDPATYAAVAVVLIATGILAGHLPARRATRIDPMAALRAE